MQLGSETVRDRFVNTVVRLYPEDGDEDEIRAGISDVFAELEELHADGDLVVLDERSARIVRATESVTYRPTANSQWHVRFSGVDDPHAGAGEMSVSADVWADDNPGANLSIPGQLGSNAFHGRPDRWRTVRDIWQRMAVLDDSEL